jgi:serine/threonine-protein kinase
VAEAPGPLASASSASAKHPPPQRGGSNRQTVASSPPPTPEDGSEGYLTFDSYPWTEVSENGKSLGTTPLVHVALPPGTHTLSLENAEQGIKKSYSVTIKSGETVSRRLGLK